MKLLNITVRNIVGLVVIIALAAVMIQLVRGQTRSPQTAQAGPTETASSVTPSVTNPPTAIPQPTSTPTNLESPSLPTIVASPIVTEPYPIFDVTVIPGPTYTPTPQPIEAANIDSPAVSVIANYELPMEQVESLSTATEELVELQLLGWTPDNKVLVQKVFYQDDNGTSRQSGVEGPWQVSPFTGEASLLDDWEVPRLLSQAQQDFVDSLIAKNMLPAGVQRAYQEDIVPNNQYVAITPTLGKIYIY